MTLLEIYDTPKDDWEEWHQNSINTGMHMNQSGKDFVNKERTKPTHTPLGSGSFAYAYTDDDANFGDVKRVSSKLSDDSTFEDDAGYAYLSWIYENKLWEDNPYFPQVRAIEQHGDIKVTITERLLPLKSSAIVDNELLLPAICNRMFIRMNNPSYATIVKRLQYCTLFDEYEDQILDKKLINALTLIRQHWIKGKGKDWDIHAGNLMWRMSPYQPHLVITDPIK